MKRLCILLLFLFFFLVGCVSSRDAITMQEFQEYVKDNNYYFTNTTDQFKDESVEDAAMAYTSVLQIEFYILKTDSDATKMFDNNKIQYEDLKTDINTYSLKEKTYQNGETYSLTTNTKYLYISRIDNTLLFLYVPVEYHNKVNKFVNGLGY